MVLLTILTRCLRLDFKLLQLDSSTKHTGFAVFKNGKLLKSGVIDESSSDINQRMKSMIQKVYLLIKKEKPNIIVFEDVRILKNVHVTVALAEILGAIIGKCVDMSIQYESISPASWRSKHDIQKPGLKRDELKQLSVDKVRELYNSDVTDDEADAILIGAAWYI